MKLLSILLMLLFSLSIFGQCELSRKDFSLRGIKLDMPISEVEKMYKVNCKVKNAEDICLIGIIEFDDAVYELSFLPEIKRQIWVVSRIDVRYSKIEFANHNEFNQALSETLRLPNFEVFEEKLNSSTILSYKVECKDFQIVSRYYGIGDANITIKPYVAPKSKPNYIFKP